MEYAVIVRKVPHGFYLGTCPLLPEADAQGRTYEACVANMKEIIKVCLRYRKSRGEDIPDEIGTERVTARYDEAASA